MRILCIGGGPAGLYLGILMKELDRSHDITILERNRPNDTFGFGVVFSDRTLDNIQHADAITYDEIARHSQLWNPIEVRIGGKTIRCGGNGFSAIARKRLLNILQERAARLGVNVHFQTEAMPLSSYADYDLIVAADGANSKVRQTYAEQFQPSVDVGKAKYIWFGTTKHFDCLTFLFEENEHGIFAVHAYPFDEQNSTFIVETDEESWRNAGLDRHVEATLAPGLSDMESMVYCQNVFAKHLDGHELIVNNSKWLNFRTLRNERWHYENIVLMGDAAHTAHFSVGSGTKMAMEDAIALSQVLHHATDIPTALADYEHTRRADVGRIQRASAPSLAWWENFRFYKDLDPEQFAFNFLTRNPRVTYDNLAVRDPHFIELVDQWFEQKTQQEMEEQTGDRVVPPFMRPLRVGGTVFRSRIAVVTSLPSSLDGLSEVDIVPDNAFYHGDSPEVPSRVEMVVTKGDAGSDDRLRMKYLVAPPHSATVLNNDEQVEQARLFKQQGGALIGIAGSAEVSQDSRLAQRLLSERIRNEVGIITAIIGGVTMFDEVNTLVLGARADLCFVDMATYKEHFQKEGVFPVQIVLEPVVY